MIIIYNVIILKRGMVYVLNERKRQLHFEELSCCFSVNVVFRVSLFTKEGNTVHMCYSNVEMSVKKLLGNFEFYSKTLCVYDATG